MEAAMDDRFNVGRWPRMQARWRGRQVALWDGDRSLTYAELEERVARLARALVLRGVNGGDRVALLLPICCEAVEVVLAVSRIGAIAVPINTRLTQSEVAFQLRDSGSRLLVCDPESLGKLFEGLLGETLPGLDLLCLPDQYEELLVEGREAPEPVLRPITEHTPHLIMYTAGTTGDPKGVILSHGNTFWQVINAVNMGLAPEVVGLNILPLFHVGGLNGSVMPVLFIGGTVVLQRQFDPVESLALIERHRVQGMVGVPTIFQMMASVPELESADLSSVVVFTSGGAPLPRHLQETYRKRGVVFRQGYGLTEAAPGVTGMDPEDAYRKPGSVGRACHHTEVRIVDETGVECPPGVPGELVVRGPNVMLGYWNRPDATAEALRDGWLHTSDIATMDADGYVTIVGRRGDMILSGGENIYPAEIEHAAADHPAVAECAVVGADDEKWGQRPVAFVACWPGHEIGAEELLAFLEDRIARFKLPREVRLLPMLPKNAAGKVLRAELRKLLESEPSPSAAAQ
jgi:fatty-acyl-CoA synthase